MKQIKKPLRRESQGFSQETNGDNRHLELTPSDSTCQEPTGSNARLDLLEIQMDQANQSGNDDLWLDVFEMWLDLIPRKIAEGRP